MSPSAVTTGNEGGGGRVGSPGLLRRAWRSVGPAIIVASVVLGPGSILAASRVGAAFGYQLIWLLALSSALMMGMVILGGRLGLGLQATPCSELARRLGRPVAATIGVLVFLIITCFQVGNNIAVVAVFRHAEAAAGTTATSWPAAIPLLVGLNALAIGALYGFRRVYRPLERLMIVLVLTMIVAFAGNLWFAGPDCWSVLRGLVPGLPDGLMGHWVPRRDGGRIVDSWGAVIALVATTLSVAGAFYQAYLVREKGWSAQEVRSGTMDALAGIAALGGITLMIMLTSAAVFHGTSTAPELRSTADVARQLEPLFGPWAKVLFNLGIFAGALSSFLVNALIGGVVLADGLGLGGSLDSRWSRALTSLVLLVALLVALLLQTTALSLVTVILLAQAMTVLGLPALAISMVYLGSRPELLKARLTSSWLLAAAWICVGVTSVLALRKAYELILKLTATS